MKPFLILSSVSKHVAMHQGLRRNETYGFTSCYDSLSETPDFSIIWQEKCRKNFEINLFQFLSTKLNDVLKPKLYENFVLPSIQKRGKT